MENLDIVNDFLSVDDVSFDTFLKKLVDNDDEQSYINIIKEVKLSDNELKKVTEKIILWLNKYDNYIYISDIKRFTSEVDYWSRNNDLMELWQRGGYSSYPSPYEALDIIGALLCKRPEVLAKVCSQIKCPWILLEFFGVLKYISLSSMFELLRTIEYNDFDIVVPLLMDYMIEQFDDENLHEDNINQVISIVKQKNNADILVWEYVKFLSKSNRRKHMNKTRMMFVENTYNLVQDRLSAILKNDCNQDNIEDVWIAIIYSRDKYQFIDVLNACLKVDFSDFYIGEERPMLTHYDIAKVYFGSDVEPMKMWKITWDIVKQYSYNEYFSSFDDDSGEFRKKVRFVIMLGMAVYAYITNDKVSEREEVMYNCLKSIIINQLQRARGLNYEIYSKALCWIMVKHFIYNLKESDFISYAYKETLSVKTYTYAEAVLLLELFYNDDLHIIQQDIKRKRNIFVKLIDEISPSIYLTGDKKLTGAMMEMKQKL